MKAMHSRYGAGPLERKDASGGDAADTVEIKKALDGFSKTLDAFMKKTDQEIAEVKKTGTTDAVTQAELKKIEDSLLDQKKLVDQMRLDNARPVMMSPDGTKTMLTADQVEHKKQFERFFRKGVESSELQAFEAKTLNVGTDPDGGYTVPVQMESAIDRVVTEISPIRQIARVVQVSSASYRKLVSKGGATSGWVGEQSSRPNTETPRLDPMDFPVMELYANPAATQSILDDSAINIEQWLADEVSIEFAQQEGRAFVSGNGSAKPRGFLSYDVAEQDSWSWNKLGYRATGVSGGFLATNPGDGATNIIDLVYSLKPAFRANARFVMNRKTISRVMKMRDADGQLLWGTNLREGQPDTLLGYPTLEAEDMPDVAADSMSIAFGDFRRGYLIVDRIGTRVLRDPFSAKPYIQFYSTKRVGGGVSHFEAIKLLKFGTS